MSRPTICVTYSHVAGPTRVHRLQGDGEGMKGKYLCLTWCGIDVDERNRLRPRKAFVPSQGPATCVRCARNAEEHREIPQAARREHE